MSLFGKFQTQALYSGLILSCFIFFSGTGESEALVMLVDGAEKAKLFILACHLFSQAFLDLLQRK